MNFLSSQLFTSGSRLTRCVALTLLPILGSECHALTQPQRGAAQRRISPSVLSVTNAYRSTPYLALILPPPLHFRLAPPPIDPALRLTAGAPPRPGGALEDVAAANQDSAITHPEDTDTTDNSPPETAVTETPSVEIRSAPTRKVTPVSIIPDDTPREIHAEEVLPFFQYPGSVPNAPTAGSLPPSSATYRQR
ncbi:MAG TPA: hypothetical protein PLN52_18395 [Opitutaceae bacterium]|nr:hypothetical protein [Opitutaceae bacterium]